MTGTYTTLELLDSVDVGYELRIEGISTSFISRPELGDGTWLGDRVTYLECLDLPRYAFGVNPATGSFKSTRTTFNLQDIDGTLVALFASVRSDVEPLESTLAAGTTITAPAPNAPQSLYSKHVGTEFIGSAGERMQYPAQPGYDIGYRHIGKLDAHSADLASIPVSASPMVWAGRRAVLLRVFHNRPVAGDDLSGVNWTSPANSRVAWFGTLMDAGEVRGRKWAITCQGPESWLRVNVGQGTFLEPAKISDTTTVFLDGEDYVGAWASKRRPTHVVSEEFGEDKLTVQLGGADLSDILSALTSTVGNALAGVGADNTYTAPTSGDSTGFFGFSEQARTFTISFTNNSPANGYRFGSLNVVMHEKAWRRLGYDPPVQASLDPQEDPKWVGFKLYQNIPWNTGPEAPPTAGYWTARIWSPGTEWDGLASFPVGEAESTRTYFPILESSLIVLSMQTPFEIEINKPGGGQIFLEGQHDQAPASAVDDATTAYSIADSVGSVDTTRLFAVVGPRRLANDWNDPENEVFIERQVFRASWVNSSGTIKEGATSGHPRLVVHEWLDPKLYGLPREKLDEDWMGLANPIEVADQIRIIPLTHMGGDARILDPLHETLQSLIVTSGTGTGHTSFYNDDQNDTIDLGENEPDHTQEPGPASSLDVDTFPMGAHVPAARMRPPWEWKLEWLSLDPEIRMAKLAYSGIQSVEQVARGAMGALGMMWHLRDAQFGWFCPWDTVSPDDVDLTVTSEAYSAGESPESAIPRQELRVYSPVDEVHLAWSWNVVDEETAYETIWKANDYGAAYRVAQVDRSIDAHGLRLGENWETALRARWSRGFEWWGRRHFKLSGQKFQRLKGQQCWPGTRIRLTDQWIVNPDGSYSVTNFAGFILGVQYDCATEVAKVDMLIQEDGAQGIHYYSPIARAFHWDSTAKRLYCYDDMFDLGFGNVDVKWFVEPSTSTVGGDLDVEIFQYNGTSWTGGIYNDVSSVNAVEGEAYIDFNSAMSGGTFYPDKDTIVVPREYANQGAAWGLALFAGIANESGQVNGDIANSVKFNGI